MKSILLGIVGLTFLVVVFVFVNDYLLKRRFRKFVERKYQDVSPLKQKLDENKPITAEDIVSLVMKPGYRQAVYQLLTNAGRADLFPKMFFTHEKAAESFLVTWLEYPTELGKAPDEIELLTKIAIDERSGYFVFKFRSDKPRWAARSHWMIGVVGPYTTGSAPYDIPKRVFSRFNKVDAISAESEVRWVHENINQR